MDVLRLQTFFSVHKLEVHILTFFECFVALTENGTVMNEDVLAALAGDEAIPFFVIEPLHFAAGHISCWLVVEARF